jgi:capsular polysaccharide export protein
MGFEALLWGCQVRCFGMPFYAGWGLTQDELPPPGRRVAASIESLVHAALIAYPRYLDPETHELCSPERLLAWMGLQRAQIERFPPQLNAVGFSRWKKPLLRRFLAGSELHFCSERRALRSSEPVLLWGQRRWRGTADQGVWRVEDGFLRSVGLGADLVKPLSWVIDGRGLYYDARTPSDLEQVLQNFQPQPALLERARCLRDTMARLRVTKYNMSGPVWRRPPGGKRVVLVVGQVESDASIALGAPGLRTNLALLQAVHAEVKARQPGAWLVYKPHPDVAAGLRSAGVGEKLASAWCDEVVPHAAITDLFEQVDEVHVLTSLAGFEALLRGLHVVVWGAPFYMGWGLTEDRLTLPRRRRRLGLDELLAACLIHYPVYVSRVSGRYATPERAVQEIEAWRVSRPAGADQVSLGRKLWRQILRLSVALRRGWLARSA